MKRWTNGLPGATKRLGAMMAQRGLSASQPRMRADTHDGPEQMLHVRGLIHCCSSHVRRSWSFCLATHGPGHTLWHLTNVGVSRMSALRGGLNWSVQHSNLLEKMGCVHEAATSLLFLGAPAVRDLGSLAGRRADEF